MPLSDTGALLAASGRDGRAVAALNVVGLEHAEGSCSAPKRRTLQ